MSLIEMFDPETGASTHVECNDAEQAHAVDAQGVSLGMVPLDTGTRTPEPPPGLYWVWDFATSTWSQVFPLSVVQAERWTLVKAQRDAAAYAPLTTPLGVFDADAAAAIKISGGIQMLQLAPMGTTLSWTLRDNSVVTLTLAQMVQVGLLLGQQVQAAYNRAQALRTQIDAAASIAEVEAITF